MPILTVLSGLLCDRFCFFKPRSWIPVTNQLNSFQRHKLTPPIPFFSPSPEPDRGAVDSGSLGFQRQANVRPLHEQLCNRYCSNKHTHGPLRLPICSNPLPDLTSIKSPRGKDHGGRAVVLIRDVVNSDTRPAAACQPFLRDICELRLSLCLLQLLLRLGGLGLELPDALIYTYSGFSLGCSSSRLSGRKHNGRSCILSDAPSATGATTRGNLGRAGFYTLSFCP